MRKLHLTCLSLFATVLLAGCGTATPAPEASSCSPATPVAHAEYVGPYLGVENVLKPGDFARDVACSDAVQARLFPRGYVTIFGSSRISENNAACDAAGGNCDPQLKQQNDAIYATTRSFARQWSAKYGRVVPIMTGAGPGLMEAANRGAAEASAPSVGYTTYYDRAATPTPQKPYGGDPSKALNAYVTHGLIFSSVVTREAAMIKHSAAMVITPGGTGTEWEIYQIVETVKSRQVLPVPVYLLGDRATYWKALDARLDDMVKRRTVRREELAFIKYAATAEELVAGLRVDLKLD